MSMYHHFVIVTFFGTTTLIYYLLQVFIKLEVQKVHVYTAVAWGGINLFKKITLKNA